MKARIISPQTITETIMNETNVHQNIKISIFSSSLTRSMTLHTINLGIIKKRQICCDQPQNVTSICKLFDEVAFIIHF